MARIVAFAWRLAPFEISNATRVAVVKSGVRHWCGLRMQNGSLLELQTSRPNFVRVKVETWIDGTAGGLVSVGAYVLVAWTYEFPALSLPARHRADLEPA